MRSDHLNKHIKTHKNIKREAEDPGEIVVLEPSSQGESENAINGTAVS